MSGGAIVISGCNVDLPVTLATPGVGTAYTSTVFDATITTLGVGATYTGPSVSGASFSGTIRNITCFFMSDQASAASGAKLQVSIDGTNWSDVATGTVNAGQAISLVWNSPISSLYYRIAYTNGGVAQGRFYCMFVGMG